jgi:hypothetical protein
MRDSLRVARRGRFALLVRFGRVPTDCRKDLAPMQCKVIDKDGQSQRCRTSGVDALVKASMTE